MGNFLFIDYKGAKNPESVFVELEITKDSNGAIKTKYTDIPILWTGSESRNMYRPTITNIPNRMERVRKILSGKLNI